MPKKKSTNSSSGFRVVDGLVILFCLAGALFCLVLFQLDLTRTLSRIGEKPVGTITWKYKAAQRRFADRVLWDRLKMESPVYDGDLIRTAILSEASVHFADGGSIDLAENSLVRISVAGVPRVDLVEGTAAAAGGAGGVVFTTGGYELVLAPGGSAVAAAGPEGGTEFQITGGSALLVSPDAPEGRELGTGASAAFRLDGAAGTEPRAVVLSPPPNARLLSSGAQALAVDFVWNRVNYGSGDLTRIDIARDRRFTRTVLSVSAGGESRQTELSPGVYYWRVYVESAGNSVVHASKLTILQASPPGPVSPAAGQSWRYYPGGRSLRFRWTRSGQEQDHPPDYYLLEAADNPEMTNLVRLQTQSTYAESPLLRPGSWFWRVSARYGDRSLVSGVIPFTVAEGGELDPPLLVVPAAESEVDIDPGDRDIYFSWKRVNGADSYTVTVSANRDMSNPLINQRVTGNYYTCPAASLGEETYYWRVSAEGSTGSSSSPPRSFTARRIPPDIRLLFPPDNYTVSEDLTPDLRFTWKTDISPLRFQLAPDPGFTGLVIDEPADKSFRGRRLPAGVWYWRLVSQIQSPVRRFTVAGALPPPVLGEADVLPGESMIFSWQPVEGAEYYRFRLYRSGGMLREQTLTGTSVSVVMDNTEGGYRWTVQAFAGEGASGSRRSGLVGTASFYFEPSEPDIPRSPPPAQAPSGPALELLLPENNLTLGMTRLRDQPFIAFSWQELEGIAEYTFILLDRNGRQILSRTVSRPFYTLDDLSVLGRGDFAWRVEADSRTGRKFLSSEYRFHIDIPAVKQSHLQDIGTLYGTE
ncbi:MAG: hypothetical protein LBJ31_08920 [Treponema sp.]|nr:hypothetical protein [Treponema sp.]